MYFTKTCFTPHFININIHSIQTECDTDKDHYLFNMNEGLQMKLTNSLLLIGTILLTACGGGGSSEPTVENSPENNSNNAPIISGIDNQFANKNTPKSILLTASDADGDELIYSVASSMDSLTVDVNSNLLTLTPQTNWSGNSLITVTASDGLLTDSTTFTLSVLAVSLPPALSLENKGLSSPPPIPVF